jgi:hypothetical protein
MTAIMRRQVHDSCATAGTPKRSLDLAAASVGLPGVGVAVWLAKNLALSVGKSGEYLNQTRV